MRHFLCSCWTHCDQSHRPSVTAGSLQRRKLAHAWCRDARADASTDTLWQWFRCSMLPAPAYKLPPGHEGGGSSESPCTFPCTPDMGHRLIAWPRAQGCSPVLQSLGPRDAAASASARPLLPAPVASNPIREPNQPCVTSGDLLLAKAVLLADSGCAPPLLPELSVLLAAAKAHAMPAAQQGRCGLAGPVTAASILLSGVTNGGLREDAREQGRVLGGGVVSNLSAGWDQQSVTREKEMGLRSLHVNANRRLHDCQLDPQIVRSLALIPGGEDMGALTSLSSSRRSSVKTELACDADDGVCTTTRLLLDLRQGGPVDNGVSGASPARRNTRSRKKYRSRFELEEEAALIRFWFEKRFAYSIRSKVLWRLAQNQVSPFSSICPARCITMPRDTPAWHLA